MRPLKLIVSGPVNAGKSTLVRSLSETEVVDTDVRSSEQIGKTHTTIGMDFGTLTIDQQVIQIWGTPGQARFDFMWDLLATGALGLIVLVAGDQPNGFPAARTIVDVITTRHPIPFVIGVTRQDLDDVWRPDEVADYFGLGSERVFGINATDRVSARESLYHVLRFARDFGARAASRQIQAVPSLV